MYCPKSTDAYYSSVYALRHCDHAPRVLFTLPPSLGPGWPLGLVVLCAEKTVAGAHAFAQLWSLLGRQLDTELRPETEALHLVSLRRKRHPCCHEVQKRPGCLRHTNLTPCTAGTILHMGGSGRADTLTHVTVPPR